MWQSLLLLWDVVKHLNGTINEDSQLGIKTEHEDQLTPIRVFEGNEDIWFSNVKSKAKSARF